MIEEKLFLEILKLSPERREKLFELLKVIPLDSQPTFLIMIHDSEGEDKSRPRAAITPFDGPEKFRYIDIIASVKNNLLSLGHPAILLAIRRWEQLIRYGGRGELYLLAKKHLGRVSRAIVAGVEARVIPPYEVWTAYERWVYRWDHDFLLVAWEALGDKKIRNVKNDDDLLSKLRERLVERQRTPEQEAVIDRIIKFIHIQFLHRRRRITWRAMQNAYNAWIAGLSPDTVKTYRSRSTGILETEGLDLKFLPSDEYENKRAFHNRKNCFYGGGLGKWGDLPVVFIEKT